MDNKPERASPFGWIIWGLFLTIINGCWGQHVHLEDAKRKGPHKVFGPSAEPPPPPLPEWVFCTIDVMLVIQLLVSAYAVWRVESGRWWLAVVLAVLWLIASMVAKTGFG